VLNGIDKKFQRDTRGCTWLTTCRTILIFFLSPSRSLSLSLSLFLLPPLPFKTIVTVITIFLRPPSGLSSNDLSIETRAGNHRTSANGTADSCVLLVPLHLPHYIQFFAGDLIGFSLLIFFLLFFSYYSFFYLPSFCLSLFFFLILNVINACMLSVKMLPLWRFWLSFLKFHLIIIPLWSTYFFRFFNCTLE